MKLTQAWSKSARFTLKSLRCARRLPHANIVATSSRRIILGSICAFAIVLSIINPLISANAERAVRANDFVESMGVATHFWIRSGEGAYGANPNAVLSKIQKMKVRFYRGYYLNSFKKYGLKGTAWVDTRSNGVLNTGGIKESLDRYKGYEKELLAVEGPNEYDTTSDRNKWSSLRNYMLQTTKQVRSRPSMKSLPILGPSMAVPFDTYKNLSSVRNSINIANIHPYSGNLRPESFWDEHQPNGRYVNVWVREARKSSSKPQVWATEVGWDQINENVQAKYGPRTYAWFFKQGIAKTMLFQMIDGDGANWGILRQDLSEKPIYNSIKNFISIIDDKNKTFSPSRLDYRLEGNTSDVETLLLQKGNRTFDLLIWQAKSSWNREKKLELSNPRRNLVLKLPKKVKSAKVYVPLQGTSPIKSLSSTSSISLAVPDHIMVVELSS